MRNLPKLESLDCRNCKRLDELSGISDTCSIDMRGCYRLKQIVGTKKVIKLNYNNYDIHDDDDDDDYNFV